MYCRLFFAVVFCLFFGNNLSIRCFMNQGDECFLGPDTNDCGSGATCQCASYRFVCTEDDTACTKNERLTGVTKWAYIVTSKTNCDAMKMAPNLYLDVKCCSNDKCNQPKNMICSSSMFTA